MPIALFSTFAATGWTGDEAGPRLIGSSRHTTFLFDILLMKLMIDGVLLADTGTGDVGTEAEADVEAV